MRAGIRTALIGAVVVPALAAAGLTRRAAPAPERFRAPEGYRDWRVISIARESGNLNDLRVILGNDVALQAARAGTLPYPDGSIIVRLAWRHDSLPESRAAFGQHQSFVAGPRVNGVQFMIKDAAKFPETGGWNFVQIEPTGAPGQVCSGCHAIVQARDQVFNRYAP
jgi:hypothetical protein